MPGQKPMFHTPVHPVQAPARSTEASRVLNNDDCSGLPPLDCSAPSQWGSTTSRSDRSARVRQPRTGSGRET